MSWFKTTLAAVLFFSVTTFSQVGSVEPVPLEVKEWTFLVFINGHNNLSDFGDMNIKDMEKVGSTKDLNILVEWGSAKSKITKRMYIEKSVNPAKVTSPSLMDMKNYDMGDYKNLQEFVRWGVKNYPAKHYFISVWNHGAGWSSESMMAGLPGFPAVNKIKPLDISFDDVTGNFITTEQMGLVMADAKSIIGRNVDIYGSDACMMQMIEVAGEMKDSVDYFVGSQENEPGEGWPYLPFLTQWTASPTMTASEISVLLSKEYLKGFSVGGIYGEKDGITFSALDLSKLDGLYNSLSNLAKNLDSISFLDMKKVKIESDKTFRFSRDDYADLGDFIKRLKVLNLKSIDMVLLDAVEASLKDIVLTTDNGKTYSKATGLSIWIPTEANANQARYDKLQSSQATGWNKFTKKILKKFFVN